MPLSFPSSPTTGQTSTQNGRTYSWTGYAWELVASSGGGSGEDTLLRSLFVPPAPTGVSASAGNAQATVSWTAPSGVLAQAPVTDYAVQFQPAGGSWQTFSDGTSTATSATVTGLTNGTAYQFRVAATNAVGTGSYSTASSAVTPVSGDALWANVQLLLPGDTSTNDVSSYNRSVSAVGGAAVSTAQKKWGAGSIAFDGTAGYITAAIPAFGSSDFVVEMWIWFNSISGSYTGLFDPRPSVNGAYPSILMNGSALSLYVGSSFVISGATPPTGQWNHIALARSSGSTRLYLNGSQTGSTYADTNTYLAASATLIGQGAGGSFLLNGYIDDLRVTVGSDRSYTGATIQVPTAAFPTVGSSGVASDGYFSSVSLLLHADGSGSTFVDSSATPKTLTAVGNATQSTAQSKWGGKSALFDGAGDGLTVPNSSELNLAGVDWVIEAWLYPTSSPQYTCVAGKRSGSDPTSYYIYIQNGVMGFYNGTVFNTSGTIPANQWTHIAWSMASGTLRAYAGGTKVGEWSSATISEVDTSLKIGRHFSSVEEAFAGYIDDLRITKGSARGYTGETIQVPTAAFPDA